MCNLKCQIEEPWDGGRYFIPYVDNDELYQPAQHCNATDVFR